MTHAWLVAQGRKGNVRPTVCPGELKPIEIRGHWLPGKVERLYKCDDCGSVLGLVGDTVEWSMSAANWTVLG
jgi:hypothetical protein